MIITIDRSSDFNPSEFLHQSGFAIESQDGYAAGMNTLDTSKLRLEYDMYEAEMRPLFRAERVGWLKKRGAILPDGPIIEALRKNPGCLDELWDDDRFVNFWGLERLESWGLTEWNRLPTIHLDGIGLSSDWDGRNFQIYTLYNRVQDARDFPYLGPWPSIKPSLVIDR